MKKFTIPFILLFFLHISAWVQAQDASVNVEQTRGKQGNFHFGVTTGLNNTWIKVDNEEQNNEHYRYKTTFKAAPIGAVVGYKFNDRHDLQLEAYLSNQGQQYDLTDNSGKAGEKNINLTYLQVPVLFKFSTGDAVRFNVHFGPQVGFLIKGEEVNQFDRTATATVAGGGTKTIGPGTYILARKEKGTSLDKPVGGLNTLDPYFVLGFGLEKDITDNLYLSGNIRFQYGFKEFRDTEVTRSPYDFDHYILRYNIYGGVQVGLHYIFSKS